MYNILFDKSKEISKPTVVSSWPHTNDCVEVTVGGLKLSYVKKEEYELALKMREILSQEQINALMPALDNYGDCRYGEGVDSEAMSRSEDI